MNSKTWFRILTLVVSLTALSSNEADISEGNAPANFQAGENTPGQFRRRHQQGKGLMKKLKQKNPKLYQEFQDARGSWRDLEPEQRKQARRNWIQTTPEARKFFEDHQGKRAHGPRLQKLKEQNPQLFEKWNEARKSWAGKSADERKEARKAFVEANPEAKKIIKHKARFQERRKKIQQLKQSHPDLFQKLKDHRKTMRNLSREDRKAARQKLLAQYPELQEIFEKRKKESL